MTLGIGARSTYAYDAVRPLGVNLREVYVNEALQPNAFEETQMYKIREFYEGRQLSNQVSAREKYIAPALFELLEHYPIFNIVNRTVKVINERLVVNGINSTSKPKAEIANKWWKQAELDSWQSVIYETALRDKACVVIIGWDGKEKRPTFAINELWDGTAGTCRIHYNNNEKVSFISKRWHEIDENGILTGRIRLNIYLDDRIERFSMQALASVPDLMPISEVKKENPEVTSNPEMLLDRNGEPLGNPAIVFENRGYLSECFEAMAPQAGVNEAILDWHTTSRYHGIPTIIFTKVQFKIDPQTGKPIEPQWGPGKGIAIDDGDIKRINPADVKSIYEGSVKPWIEIVTRAKGWPEHVFTQIPPSGETIRQMEGSLVSQCDAKKTMFSDSWVKAFNLAFKLKNLYDNSKDEALLEFHWKSSLSISDKYDLQLLALKKSVLGLPQKYILLEMGYTEEEANLIIAESDKEKIKNANVALNAVQNRQNDTGNPAGARGVVGLPTAPTPNGP